MDVDFSLIVVVDEKVDDLITKYRGGEVNNIIVVFSTPYSPKLEDIDRR